MVHAVGGWLALGAVLLLGPRMGRYTRSGKLIGIPPSSIPWLALGSWLLCTGWFGFDVMSAQSLKGVTGLVAMNSLMAMIGGVLSALVVGKKDPGFVHNGALAGLVAVCAGSDVMHPIGSFFVGGVAGWLPCNASDYGAAYEVLEATCDGLDNDCDGFVDESLVGTPCPTQIGVCAGSREVCQGTLGWKACDVSVYSAWSADYEPTEVTCDFLDNDCDNQLDENLIGALCPLQDGICAGVRQQCVGGKCQAP